MITIEEKLNVFNKLVLGHVQIELEEKYNEINKQNNEIIEEHKKKLHDKKERIIEDYIAKGKNEKNKLISQSNLDRKRLVLTQKQEFIEKVVEGLYERAKEFCNSEEYKTFIARILDEILPRFSEQKGIDIYMKEKDIDLFAQLLKEIAERHGFSKERVHIKNFQEDFIGGVMVFNQDMTLKMDYSINTIIEENRWRIGQKVYEALQESGDVNG